MIGKDWPNKQAAWRIGRALPRREAGAVGWAKNSGYLALAKRRPARGEGNFLREAPHATAVAVRQGLPAVLDFAGKEFDATAEGDQDVATRLADINRETQDATTEAGSPI